MIKKLQDFIATSKSINHTKKTQHPLKDQLFQDQDPEQKA